MSIDSVAPRLLGVVATLFIAAIALACLPIPHMQREAPAVEGVVRRNGAPASGVRVTIAVNNGSRFSCANRRAETTSDSQGRFRLPETRYFTPIFAFGDRRDSWVVCFDFPGATRASWFSSAWWGGPQRQRVDCDVVSPANPTGSIPLATGTSSSPPGDHCVVAEEHP